MVTSMMRKARKPQPGEKKHTMQCAFPFSSLREVIYTPGYAIGVVVPRCGVQVFEGI
jgi:hypothetical protein